MYVNEIDHLLCLFCEQGALHKAIKLEDSTWSLDAGKEILVELQKVTTMEWWKSVIVGAPEIDTSSLTPESSNLSDLDGDTRGMVEKMMVLRTRRGKRNGFFNSRCFQYDQRQKAAGLPTSEEQTKAAAFEKFKRAHPEMDVRIPTPLSLRDRVLKKFLFFFFLNAVFKRQDAVIRAASVRFNRGVHNQCEIGLCIHTEIHTKVKLNL